MKSTAFITTLIGLIVLAVACGSAESSPSTTAVPAEPLKQLAIAESGDTRLVFGDDTQASYSVREQLASLGLPNDAVGGSIVLDVDGNIRSDASRITVDLSTLESDSNRRDSYLRDNSLETNQYPLAVFVPTEAFGLPTPLPESGSATFQLVGNMTVHGVINEVTWNVDVSFDRGDIVGSATTSFPFSTFDMDVPSVFIVLSVEDEIRLQIDFVLSEARTTV